MAAPIFHKIRMIAELKRKTMAIEVPTGSTKGDTLHVCINVAAVVVITAPAGWSAIAASINNGAETVAWFELPNWNGETASYTFEWGGAEKISTGSMSSYSGTDLATPRNATGASKKNEATKNAVVNGLVTTVDECLLVTYEVNDSGFTAVPGAGYTEDGDQASGPEVCHKTAAVNKGEQAAVTHVLNNTAISMTIMAALQPPQAAASAGTAMVV